MLNLNGMNATQSTMARLLNSMDLEVQGNAGFGGRMGWFLAEMHQLMQEKSK